LTGAGTHPVPVAPGRLADLLADLIDAAGPQRLSVAVDGSPAANPAGLADTLVEPLHARGRRVARVSGADFLRPASVRLEQGREDSESYRSGRLDVAGLRREVLDPFAAGGRYLPSLWDAARDRATRAAPLEAPPGTVLVVDGTFLLDGELAFDLALHLHLKAATLARRTPEVLQWTLPAYAGYAGKARANVVVRLDDVAHPAVLVRRG